MSVELNGRHQAYEPRHGLTNAAQRLPKMDVSEDASREPTQPDPSVIISVSAEARAALESGVAPSPIMSTNQDAATNLPDVLVTAVRRDYMAYRQTLRRFGPLTSAEEAQAQVYLNAQAARGQQAFDMVSKAVSLDGLDLNDPAQKAVYEQITNDLMATAYVALSNPSKTINGPGADDLPASAFINTLRTITITIHGGLGPDNLAGTTTYAPGGPTHVDLYAGSINAVFGHLGTTTAVSTALFHEMGHALAASRTEAETSLANYRAGVGAGLTYEQSLAGWMGSNDRLLVEQRTTARGLGLAELAGRPFAADAINGGSAPR